MDRKLTREEAIKVLRSLQDWLYLCSMNGGTKLQREAIDIAIAALEGKELMSKKPVYICNHKRCMVCYRTLCGRTFDKEFAELDENGEPIIADYYDDEEVNLEEVEK